MSLTCCISTLAYPPCSLAVSYSVSDCTKHKPWCIVHDFRGMVVWANCGRGWFMLTVFDPHQWLLTIPFPDLTHSWEWIIPTEAYVYCCHLSFPCCFHRHYSFLYSFSWQPFSLLLSLERHFETKVDRHDTTTYFHLDIDKSSTASYDTVQTSVTTKWEYQKDLSYHMNQQLHLNQ
jgi:hypothetical protein